MWVFAVRVFLEILLSSPYQCLECPFGCECFAVTRTVKCVSEDLLAVPQSTPGYAKTVIITGNNIHQVGPESFTEMENVTNIILSNNRWECQCVVFSFIYIEPYLDNIKKNLHVYLINSPDNVYFSEVVLWQYIELCPSMEIRLNVSGQMLQCPSSSQDHRDGVPQLLGPHQPALPGPQWEPIGPHSPRSSQHTWQSSSGAQPEALAAQLHRPDGPHHGSALGRSRGGLLRLDLSGNHLALLPPGMFSHLPNLQQLFLTNNSLVAIYSGTFSATSRLELVDLTHNVFTTFRADALQELQRLGNIQILLGDNPYTCSCEISHLVAWLNESRAQVDVNAVRCASPRGLRDTRLRGLSGHAIGCVDPVQGEVLDLTLQTSYVFLGLVLGLVGMVFLFVLYLNRKGMKKWIVEMRDAWREVLEAYHHRCEVDSDPRLRHISAENSGSRAQGNLGWAFPRQLPSDSCIVKLPADTQVKQMATSPPVNLWFRNK